MVEPTKQLPRLKEEAVRLWREASTKPGYVSRVWWCLEKLARQLDGAKIVSKEGQDVGDEVRGRFLELLEMLIPTSHGSTTSQSPGTGSKPAPTLAPTPNTTGPWPRSTK